MSRYLTIVYEINDEAAFAEHQARIDALWMEGKGAPVRITAFSKGHEIRRVELIDDALINGDCESIPEDVREIIDCDDPTTFEFS